MRWILALTVALGVAGCAQPNPPSSSPAPAVSNEPSAPNIRVSGYARFGVSVKN